MRVSLITRSFLPFAIRFFYRHPTRLSMLRQHWVDYVGRFGKMAELTGKEVGLIEAMFYELELQEPLFQENKGWTGLSMHSMIYYVLVRLMQPDLVVETGVCEGFSSRFILLAMERNGRGFLHSIDLPNADIELGPGRGHQNNILPEGRVTGWQVPKNLRTRWQLHLGDAKELLPGLLQNLGRIDIFIHDSLHSYDHMMFEYVNAWSHLKEGGILLSDDTDWNPAFAEFAAKANCSPILFNYRVGAIRKPESRSYA